VAVSMVKEFRSRYELTGGVREAPANNQRRIST
jgi:hypothetical protein